MSYSYTEKEFYQRGGRSNYSSCFQDLDWEQVRIRSFANGKRYSLVDKILSKRKCDGTVLEWGCGHGENLRYIVAKHGFSNGIGMDVIFEEKLLISDHPHISLMAANLNENVPLEDSSIDTLVAMMVVEHLFDPFHAFSEISRLLSPQGVAIINLPLVTAIKNRLRLLLGQLPSTSVKFDRWFADKSWDGNHLHYFSLRAIRRLCDVSGLRIVNYSGCGNLLLLKNLAPEIFASELTFAVKKV